jgi:hypothetical protein
MTQDEAIARLKELITAGEGGHATHVFADDVLLAVLRANGLSAVADAYDRLNEELPFWYS